MPIRTVTLLFCFLSIANTYGGPIIIRSGLHLGKQNAMEHGEEAGLFGVHGKMQLANYEAEEGFNHGDEKQYAAAQDQGIFKIEDKDLVKHQDEADYQDKAFKQEDGSSVVDEGSKKGHKKGHQKSAFHNTYHKDESGSNSSYFDESLDAADHYNRNSNKGIYADNAQHNQHGYHRNDKENLNDNHRQGQYDNGGHYLKNQGASTDYSRKQYSDNDKVVDNHAAGNAYEEGGRLIRDEVVQKTPYWNQPYASLPPPPPPIASPAHYPFRQNPYNSRVTIFEDPAYVRPNNYREYDGPRYYDDRRNDFDYYY